MTDATQLSQRIAAGTAIAWALGVLLLASLCIAIAHRSRDVAVDAQLLAHTLAAYGLGYWDAQGVFHDEFLLLEAWQCVLGCILWIRIYCKEILEDEQSLVDLTGQRLTDYAGNESANLEAIRRALEPHSELSAFAEILRRYFSAPLRENH